MRLILIVPSTLTAIAISLCGITFCQGTSISPEVAVLINKPSIIDHCQAINKSRSPKSVTSENSPLVFEAKVYAKLLNPPEPVQPPTPQMTLPTVATKPITHEPPQPRVIATPQKMTATFKVHATSVFAKQPQKSMALISEPGKGLSWVRPGDKVGHLQVDEIHKDKVIYSFKDTNGEVAWEPPQTSTRPVPKPSAPSLAMHTPSPKVSPKPIPSPYPEPIPSRLAAPNTPQRRLPTPSTKHRRSGR